MSNMSYCRFHNTSLDLEECLAVVLNRYYDDGDEYSAVSDEECERFKIMVHQIADFFNDLELLDEDGYVDENKLDEVVSKMQSDEEDEE